jgi:DNA invertase Pin-like site-specific DNA recombinase
MKIAIYARVSKSDESQDPLNQLNPLRDYAKAIGGEVVAEFVDLSSGGNSERENFLRMLNDADRRKFDLLLIWALDRFSREGISNTLGYFQRLQRNGVAIKSLKESWLDTQDSGLGQLLLAIFSWVAQQERMRIVERTKAGLERARKEGKKLGRPAGKKDSSPRARSGYYVWHMKNRAEKSSPQNLAFSAK